MLNDIDNKSINDKNILEIREFLQQFKCMNINDEKDKNKKINYNNKINIIYPKSSSLFRRVHHRNMNIIIKNVNNKKYIINVKDKFKDNKIIEDILKYYKTLKNDFEEKQCNRYINKINEVIKNTKNKISYESIIDDFVRTLFEIFDLDDGKILNIQSQYKLYLKIGNKKIPSVPDLICKTNSDIIWLVEESKHINNTTYLEGDLQLICHMISAFQYNNEKKELNIPNVIFGFKIKNTKCFFYKIEISDKYINCLINNNFDTSIFVYKYPEKGFDINPYNIDSYKNIEEFFNILYNLKDYAASM